MPMAMKLARRLRRDSVGFPRTTPFSHPRKPKWQHEVSQRVNGPEPLLSATVRLVSGSSSRKCGSCGCGDTRKQDKRARGEVAGVAGDTVTMGEGEAGEVGEVALPLWKRKPGEGGSAKAGKKGEKPTAMQRVRERGRE